MKAFIFLLACAVLTLPTPADACSCVRGSPDLHEALRDALSDSDMVFHGRVKSVGPRLKLLSYLGVKTDWEARLEVLEVFKGKPGGSLVLPSGPTASCEYPFTEGDEFLVYVNDYDGQPVSTICSRTRPAFKSDVELDWLRTGVLPSVPVALQRQSVRCEPCDLDTVAEELGDKEVGNKDAESALKTGKPFWVSGYSDHEDPTRLTAVGLSRDGRPFELVQTPYNGTNEACRQRVTRRWCEKLVPAPRARRNVPALQCVNPGPAEEVCDEEKSREVTWLPRESMSAATCEWHSPTETACELAKEPRPLDAGAPTSPLLSCRPTKPPALSYACQVRKGMGVP
ncbi:hypothetical protein HPC49_09595 [Pyxidicoccus fallax]|uniref:Lipoprotein n=1 Tax=Pyxidicoccus fallax TaxID=394095 RepID=A0A848LDC2_9BACT|nr:hypothetical protein [Pyxidicoccus fallax]NMO16404.1 hypothetical protein [Pyxidicoccus fallax]NPC78496.1 hypothetical protein [Pyxidicoccus fallax]